MRLAHQTISAFSHLGLQGIDKAALMTEVSSILHELQGTVFTGCDLNTSMEDMEILVRPFLLVKP